MVSAVGVEPDPGQFTNVLMAHDFRRNTLSSRRLQPSIESSGVPYSPLESTSVVETFWRRKFGLFDQLPKQEIDRLVAIDDHHVALALLPGPVRRAKVRHSCR